MSSDSKALLSVTDGASSRLFPSVAAGSASIVPLSPLHESAPSPEADQAEAGSRAFERGIPLAAPDVFAPTLSLSLVAGKVLSSVRPPKVRWGKPVHHAAIAAVSSGHVAALWWSLFLYGGSEGASALAILLSSMIPNMVVGGYMASLIHDAVQAPVLEAGVKPRLAQASRALGTEELTPSLEGSMGFADYEYHRFSYQLIAIKHELSLHHALEERRVLRQGSARGALSPAESALLAKYDGDVADCVSSLRKEDDNLRAVGLSLPASLLEIMEAETDSTGSSADSPETASRRKPRANADSVSALWGTFSATSLLTAGAMFAYFGPPQWTDNTQGLFTFFGLSALFNTFVGYIYQRTVQENVQNYQIRPLESRINRWFKSWFGRDIFPIAAGMLGIPDSDRYKTMFDRSVNTGNVQGHLLEGRAIRLKSQGELNADERKRLNAWEDVLGRLETLTTSIKVALEKIDA